MKAPKHTKRQIYWDENGGSVFLLVGYCPDTLAYFQALYQDALGTFPDLKSEDVTCGKVTSSLFIKGFTLITFFIKGPRREFKGYDNYNGPIDFGY